jgi:4'-phosphopantetheinyl transferase
MSSDALQKGAMVVWQLCIDGLEVHEKSVTAVLSSEERARVARFHRPQDRLRFVGARSALRQLLGTHLNMPAVACEFGYTELGKPFLSHPTGTDLHFNISHSGSLVLIAMTKGNAVGIDVEEVRAQFDYAGVIESAFTSREREELLAVAAPDRLQAFFRMWTRKEAYLKCLGLGLQEIDAVTIDADAERNNRFLFSFSPASGYAAALALDGPCAGVCVIHLEFDESHGTFAQAKSGEIV